MNVPRPWLLGLALLATLAMLVVLARPARADGMGELRLVEVPVAGYYLSLATDPSPLTTGTATVNVLLQDPARQPQLDAQVTLRAAPLGEPLGPAVPARLGASANRLLYSAALPLDRAGTWQLVVMVAGPLGREEVTTTLTVEPAPPWPPLAPVVMVLLPSLLVVAGFLARQRRARRGLTVNRNIS
ncbi:MAG: hypothetical protein K6U89_01925 [Chloroflexi bacterium]|nr:hypothetical protein [Chloroflexota bacterium]